MVALAVQGINLFKIAGRSISHIQQLQTISDDNDDFVPAGQDAAGSACSVREKP